MSKQINALPYRKAMHLNKNNERVGMSTKCAHGMPKDSCYEHGGNVKGINPVHNTAEYETSAWGKSGQQGISQAGKYVRHGSELSKMKAKNEHHQTLHEVRSDKTDRRNLAQGGLVNNGMYTAKGMSDAIRSKRKELDDTSIDRTLDTSPGPDMNPQDIYNSKQQAQIDSTLPTHGDETEEHKDPADADTSGTSQDDEELTRHMARVAKAFRHLK